LRTKENEGNISERDAFVNKMTEFQILIFSADGYSNGYDIQLNYFREKYKISQFVLVTIKRINHIANVKSSEYEKGVLKFRYPSKFH